MIIKKKSAALLIFLALSMYVTPGCALTRLSTHRARRSLRTPANFGKTNFIVGLPADYAGQPQRNRIEHFDNATCINEAYFSPDDDLQRRLIDYINQEKKAIYLAVFSFTDKKIADALIAVHKRGVHIEIVVDAGFLSDRFSKISYLQEHGILIYLYNPKQSPKNEATLSNIMHNKFALFECNVDGHPLVWTGSFNFTKSAQLNNQENVVVLGHGNIVTRFRKQFRTLKERTVVYNPKKKRTK